MKVLITSGGTTEPIDSVRGISNFASGRLGLLTAEQFLAAGHQVWLLVGDKALRPAPQENLTLIPIMGTQNLYEQMENLVPQVDVVVHSMAVSDYRPVYMTGLENLPLSELTRDDLIHFQPEQAKKISSKSDYQIMLLEKTPKIISYIKKWNPQVILFGFKLLAGVSQDELISVAREKLVSNQANYIIANDIENIHGDQHQALLVSTDKISKMNTKSEIAATILKIAESETERRTHG